MTGRRKSQSPTKTRPLRGAAQTKGIPTKEAAELFGPGFRTAFELGKFISANEEKFGKRVGEGKGLQQMLELTEAGEKLFGKKKITLSQLYSGCGKFFTKPPPADE